MEGLIISLMIFLIIFTEIFLVQAPMFGFVPYLIFLTIVFFILSKNEELNKFEKLIVLLSVIPLVKILQFFISLPFPWKNFISYGILLILGIYYAVWFKIPIRLKGNYFIIPLVVILGVLLGFLGKPFLNTPSEFSFFLIFTVVFAEELFFRGLLQKVTASVLGNFLSIIVPSLFYSLFHTSLGFFALVYFFGFGIISGIIYHFTRNLNLCIIMGIAVNLVIFIPF